jgi:hypothetical protein
MVGSDHCPIFFDTGENCRSNQKNFYFERQWLVEEDLKELFCRN